MSELFLLLSLIVTFFTAQTAANERLRVCYYSNWSQYRNSVGKFKPTDIDPDLCTHLVYSFAKLTTSYELATFEWNDDVLYGQFNGLKNNNTKLKTLIAVGGWNEGSTKFTALVSNAALRAKFVSTSVAFVQRWGFDGLDLDWEYPAARGGASSDKANFAKLLQELRVAFDAENPKLLLTAAVPAGKTYIDAGYDVPELNKTLDYIFLMAYDLHGAWEAETGFNAPLFHRTSETAEQQQLNVAWTANYWASEGISKDKLIIGLATYGRSFTLTNANSYNVGAPASGAGQQGPYTASAGFLAYYEICNKLDQGTRYWDAEQKVPYLVVGSEWIGYDDIQSITEKVNWIVDEGFGGAMVWNIDLDDFNKNCAKSTRPYPLMNTMKDILEGNDPPQTTVDPGTTDTPDTTDAPDTTESQTTDPSTTEVTYPQTGSTGTPSSKDYLRVCYYSNWSQYRSYPGTFTPSDIDTDLCTHLIYSFAKLNDQSQLGMYEWNDDKLYVEFNALKKDKPLKTLLGVGGWTHGSLSFSAMAKNVKLRSKFVTTSVTYLKKWGFDGLDIDWEYPGSRGGIPEDKENFVLLIKELRAAYDAQTPPLLLSAAVPAGLSSITPGYNIPEVNRYLHFINLMSYDLHGSWDPTTGFHTALYPRAGENTEQARLNVEWAANHWVEQGASKEKLIIGLATYGRSFELSNTGNVLVDAPASGPGSAGSITGASGFLAYYEICSQIDSGAGNEYFHPEHRVPYYVNGDQWVGYENVNSMVEKTEWIMKEGFGGAMFWNVDLDDFRGDCPSSTRNYPLMSVVTDMFDGKIPPTKSTPPTPPTPVTTITPVTGGPDTNGFCSERADGFYTDPYNCEMFYQCEQQCTYHKDCPNNLRWNDVMKYCDWDYNVPCVELTSTTSQPQTTTPEDTTEFCEGKVDDLYEDVNNCSMYYHCWTECTYHEVCPDGKQWNKDAKICDLAENVNCGTVQSSSTETTTEDPVTSAQTTADPGNSFCVDKRNGIYKNNDDCGSYYNCWQGIGNLYNCNDGQLFDAHILSCRLASEVDCSLEQDTEFCVGRNGLFPYPLDCKKYYNCANDLSYIMTCQDPYLYNPNGYCDWDYNVNCDERPIN